MLQDLVPVQRHLISMDLIPDRPKWLEAENVLKIEDGRTFIARDASTLQQVVGVVVGEILAYCHVQNLPSFPLGSEESAPEFIVKPNEWVRTSQPVDMHTAVDLGFVDARYIETMFYSPVEMFVKSTLARARPNSGALARFRSLVCAPETLARAHAQRRFANPEMQRKYNEWRLQQPAELLSLHEAGLKQKETQLQVVLLLEIFAHDPSVEPQLDAHFDRLLLWQTLSESSRDSVLEFCQNVLWNFFRQSSRHKVTQLIMRAKGKPESKVQKPATSTPSITLKSASRSASLLERARALRFRPPPPPPPQHEPVAAKAQRTLVDQKPNKREVEISFKSSSVKQSQTQSQNQSQNQSQGQGPPRKRLRPVHVYATPVANRTRELPKEDIELPNLEVESTDEDE